MALVPRLGMQRFCLEVNSSILANMWTHLTSGCVGMILSRVGLWAFDLCQLKELQLALASHPRRNWLYVPPVIRIILRWALLTFLNQLAPQYCSAEFFTKRCRDDQGRTSARNFACD